MIEATNEFDPCVKHIGRRITYQRGQKPFRMVLEIQIARPGHYVTIDPTLWKALRLPPGWRKNARQRWHASVGLPVRFQCVDPAKALTEEQIEVLRAQLALMVK